MNLKVKKLIVVSICVTMFSSFNVFASSMYLLQVTKKYTQIETE